MDYKLLFLRCKDCDIIINEVYSYPFKAYAAVIGVINIAGCQN